MKNDLSAFYGPNAGYVIDLYELWKQDPASVDDAWAAFFGASAPDALQAAVERGKSQPATVAPTTGPAGDITKAVNAARLAEGIRRFGHLAVQLDPIGATPPGSAQLELSTYGLTEADLQTLPAVVVGGHAAAGAANALEAITALRARYTNRIGYDFGHVQNQEEQAWLSSAAESGEYDIRLDAAGRTRLLDRLSHVEAYEQFIHKTYPGVKRFSIEGVDTLVPMLDQVIADATDAGSEQVVIGMAHRGRLSVLAHNLDVPYGRIIGQFEGHHDAAIAPDDYDMEAAIEEVRAGDVKYHLGARKLKDPVTGEPVDVPIILAPNPSHLEAVNPVVMGMTRACQDVRTAPGDAVHLPEKAAGILIHGDAAFIGQGVNAETMNMNALEGFNTGGMVHIIANNQIGYTTDPEDSRSTIYASDLAKGFDIPVIHVNADDAEACLTATHFGMSYRRRFNKDLVIDLVGYRRYGHNEGDEPMFTQPVLYKKIQKHPTVRQVYADQLVADGVLTADEAQGMYQTAFNQLTDIRHRVVDGSQHYPDEWIEPMRKHDNADTAIENDRLRELQTALHTYPDGFTLNPKLKRQLGNRAKVLDVDGGTLDWAHGESLAFAAILQDGVAIRFSGEDAQRGTWSQRHLVLHDYETDDEYTPLHHIPGAEVSFTVYNSPLSEYGGMGFEYGYNQSAENTLVLWEAQFGDFANGAAIIFDQFIAASRSKWGSRPSLVLLLPHGYEGQGPEHSNGRSERTLQLFGEDNMRIANCTSSANYFHLLRLQAQRLTTDARPLIIYTPKSLLRHPLAASAPEEFTEGHFQPVMDDKRAHDRKDKVTRLVLCTGKVAIDLEASELRDTEHVAVARVELIAPFQSGPLQEVIDSYPNLTEIVWLQEEPRNMGAWSFMGYRLQDLVGNRFPIRYIGRPESASPAEGYAETHKASQQAIVEAAFAATAPADTAEPDSQASNGVADPIRKKAGALSVKSAD